MFGTFTEIQSAVCGTFYPRLHCGSWPAWEALHDGLKVGQPRYGPISDETLGSSRWR